jgi:hypothetical protein
LSEKSGHFSANQCQEISHEFTSNSKYSRNYGNYIPFRSGHKKSPE